MCMGLLLASGVHSDLPGSKRPVISSAYCFEPGTLEVGFKMLKVLPGSFQVFSLPPRGRSHGST
jgi:hypothetical protein